MKKLALLFSIISLFFFFVPDITSQTINRGPYLQKVTTSSIYIHWRTSSSTSSKVWYGTNVNNLNMTETVSGSRTNHEVELSGLQENTTYYYAVGYNNTKLAGEDSDHYFNTSPNQNTNQTIRAWVLGNAGHKNDDQEDVRDAYYDYNNGDHIDMMLLLGDNAYDDGTDNDYQVAWFENTYGYSDRLINSVMWSTFGNHEEPSSDAVDETGPYFDIFNFPKNAEAGGVASGKESYYSFDYGNVHFICLNANEMDEDDTYRANMLSWLQDDLDDSNVQTQEWIIAFCHYPPYTGTDNNSSDTHSKEKPVRELILPILEAGGVDLVFGSHHHSYQRSHLINGHYDVSNTWDENTMGIDMGDGRVDGNGAYTKAIGDIGTVYMVAGSAGNSSNSDPSGHPVQYTAIQGLGSVELEITGLEMSVKFIQDDESIGDYFTMIKTPDGTPSVAITNPDNNEFYSAPELINIIADASDESPGTISQVEFFIDNVSIGTDNSSPYSNNWTPPGNGTFEIKAIATDNDNLTSTSQITINVGNVITSSQVAGNNDDAEEDLANGNTSVSSSDIEMAVDGSEVQLIGMRFNNLNIPQGAVIENAYIQFTYKNGGNVNPCSLDIYGQDSDNASEFSSGNNNNNISTRPKTTATVNWSPSNWQNSGDAGPAQKTPDISSVIQEVVNRTNYTSNSSIAILIDGTGRRRAYSYNGSSSEAPVLTVEYSMDAPLPIELLDFNAKSIGKEIRLDWSTASETNNDYFTIERSIDGRIFEAIGTQAGSGTSSEMNNYSFLDKSPERGLNYYRLKQTDFDRQYSYSNVVSAKINIDNEIQVYPTLVEDILTVQRSSDNHGETMIIIHDITGRSFLNSVIEENELKKELSLIDLNQGIYFISIYNSEEVQTFKIVKL